MVDFHKCGISGVLFEPKKLYDPSRKVISCYSAEEIYKAVAVWTEKYDRELFDLMYRYSEYTLNILIIERKREDPRRLLGMVRFSGSIEIYLL